MEEFDDYASFEVDIVEGSLEDVAEDGFEDEGHVADESLVHAGGSEEGALYEVGVFVLVARSHGVLEVGEGVFLEVFGELLGGTGELLGTVDVLETTADCLVLRVVFSPVDLDILGDAFEHPIETAQVIGIRPRSLVEEGNVGEQKEDLCILHLMPLHILWVEPLTIQQEHLHIPLLKRLGPDPDAFLLVHRELNNPDHT